MRSFLAGWRGERPRRLRAARRERRARWGCRAAPVPPRACAAARPRSEEHTSELQSPCNLVCRLLLEKKNKRLNHVDHSLNMDVLLSLPSASPPLSVKATDAQLLTRPSLSQRSRPPFSRTTFTPATRH